MKKIKAFGYLVLTLCLVFYALPRLPFYGHSQVAAGFAVIWLSFALVVTGAHLLDLVEGRKPAARTAGRSLAVTEETKRKVQVRMKK